MTRVRTPGLLRISLAAATLLPAAALAGCGGSGGGTGGMMGGGPTGTGSGGRALYVEYCGSCHTLAAAGTGGSAGPNLDQARPSYDRVVELVTNGRGVMPALGRSLTRSQIQAIARYVSTAAR